MFADSKGLIGDAAVNFQILEKTGVPIEHRAGTDGMEGLEELLSGAAWIVDGLLGTGARGEPRPPFDSVIDWINSAKAPKLAIDLPSGLDCDTGQAAEHTIRAAHTCTFAVAKPGLLVADARPYVGQLHVLDIGAPRRLIAQMLAEEPRRT
jgi:NAD(P)H-hydrate epimerase